MNHALNHFQKPTNYTFTWKLDNRKCSAMHVKACTWFAWPNDSTWKDHVQEVVRGRKWTWVFVIPPPEIPKRVYSYHINLHLCLPINWALVSNPRGEQLLSNPIGMHDHPLSLGETTDRRIIIKRRVFDVVFGGKTSRLVGHWFAKRGDHSIKLR